MIASTMTNPSLKDHSTLRLAAAVLFLVSFVSSLFYAVAQKPNLAYLVAKVVAALFVGQVVCRRTGRMIHTMVQPHQTPILYGLNMFLVCGLLFALDTFLIWYHNQERIRVLRRAVIYTLLTLTVRINTAQWIWAPQAKAPNLLVALIDLGITAITRPLVWTYRLASWTMNEFGLVSKVENGMNAVESKTCSTNDTDAPDAPAPVVADAPVAADTPVLADAPVVTDTPLVADAPHVADAPVVADAPLVADTPVLADAPVVADAPLVADAPDSKVHVAPAAETPAPDPVVTTTASSTAPKLSLIDVTLRSCRWSLQRYRNTVALIQACVASALVQVTAMSARFGTFARLIVEGQARRLRRARRVWYNKYRAVHQCIRNVIKYDVVPYLQRTMPKVRQQAVKLLMDEILPESIGIGFLCGFLVSCVVFALGWFMPIIWGVATMVLTAAVMIYIDLSARPADVALKPVIFKYAPRDNATLALEATFGPTALPLPADPSTYVTIRWTKQDFDQLMTTEATEHQMLSMVKVGLHPLDAISWIKVIHQWVRHYNTLGYTEVRMQFYQIQTPAAAAARHADNEYQQYYEYAKQFIPTHRQSRATKGDWHRTLVVYGQ